ncbi:hypothetical protein DPMN_187910 [Dreissena polymorpha]|uniref:Uncharacterized protein n=1 Tax=Dreissena polymorpha TaxID=45954 RepID=A0A9D4DRY5_DREPO|nr:hypothetical protein DPMN_187910 [Dreissena polymorpha]
MERQNVNRTTSGRSSDVYRRGMELTPQDCRKVLMNQTFSGRQSGGQRPYSVRASDVLRKEIVLRRLENATRLREKLPMTRHHLNIVVAAMVAAEQFEEPH